MVVVGETITVITREKYKKSKKTTGQVIAVNSKHFTLDIPGKWRETFLLADLVRGAFKIIQDRPQIQEVEVVEQPDPQLERLKKTLGHLEKTIEQLRLEIVRLQGSNKQAVM